MATEEEASATSGIEAAPTPCTASATLEKLGGNGAAANFRATVNNPRLPSSSQGLSESSAIMQWPPAGNKPLDPPPAEIGADNFLRAAWTVSPQVRDILGESFWRRELEEGRKPSICMEGGFCKLFQTAERLENHLSSRPSHRVTTEDVLRRATEVEETWQKQRTEKQRPRERSNSSNDSPMSPSSRGGPTERTTTSSSSTAHRSSKLRHSEGHRTRVTFEQTPPSSQSSSPSPSPPPTSRCSYLNSYRKSSATQRKRRRGKSSSSEGQVPDDDTQLVDLCNQHFLNSCELRQHVTHAEDDSRGMDEAGAVEKKKCSRCEKVFDQGEYDRHMGDPGKHCEAIKKTYLFRPPSPKGPHPDDIVHVSLSSATTSTVVTTVSATVSTTVASSRVENVSSSALQEHQVTSSLLRASPDEHAMSPESPLASRQIPEVSSVQQIQTSQLLPETRRNIIPQPDASQSPILQRFQRPQVNRQADLPLPYQQQHHFKPPVRAHAPPHRASFPEHCTSPRFHYTGTQVMPGLPQLRMSSPPHPPPRQHPPYQHCQQREREWEVPVSSTAVPLPVPPPHPPPPLPGTGTNSKDVQQYLSGNAVTKRIMVVSSKGNGGINSTTNTQSHLPAMPMIPSQKTTEKASSDASKRVESVVKQTEVSEEHQKLLELKKQYQERTRQKQQQEQDNEWQLERSSGNILDRLNMSLPRPNMGPIGKPAMKEDIQDIPRRDSRRQWSSSRPVEIARATGSPDQSAAQTRGDSVVKGNRLPPMVQPTPSGTRPRDPRLERRASLDVPASTSVGQKQHLASPSSGSSVAASTAPIISRPLKELPPVTSLFGENKSKARYKSPSNVSVAVNHTKFPPKQGQSVNQDIPADPLEGLLSRSKTTSSWNRVKRDLADSSALGSTPSPTTAVGTMTPSKPVVPAVTSSQAPTPLAAVDKTKEASPQPSAQGNGDLSEIKLGTTKPNDSTASVEGIPVKKRVAEAFASKKVEEQGAKKADKSQSREELAVAEKKTLKRQRSSDDDKKRLKKNHKIQRSDKAAESSKSHMQSKCHPDKSNDKKKDASKLVSSRGSFAEALTKATSPPKKKKFIRRPKVLYSSSEDEDQADKVKDNVSDKKTVGQTIKEKKLNALKEKAVGSKSSPKKHSSRSRTDKTEKKDKSDVTITKSKCNVTKEKVEAQSIPKAGNRRVKKDGDPSKKRRHSASQNSDKNPKAKRSKKEGSDEKDSSPPEAKGKRFKKILKTKKDSSIDDSIRSYPSAMDDPISMLPSRHLMPVVLLRRADQVDLMTAEESASFNVEQEVTAKVRKMGRRLRGPVAKEKWDLRSSSSSDGERSRSPADKCQVTTARDFSESKNSEKTGNVEMDAVEVAKDCEEGTDHGLGADDDAGKDDSQGAGNQGARGKGKDEEEKSPNQAKPSKIMSWPMRLARQKSAGFSSCSSCDNCDQDDLTPQGKEKRPRSSEAGTEEEKVVENITKEVYVMDLSTRSEVHVKSEKESFADEKGHSSSNGDSTSQHWLTLGESFCDQGSFIAPTNQDNQEVDTGHCSPNAAEESYNSTSDLEVSGEKTVSPPTELCRTSRNDDVEEGKQVTEEKEAVRNLVEMGSGDGDKREGEVASEETDESTVFDSELGADTFVATADGCITEQHLIVQADQQECKDLELEVEEDGQPTPSSGVVNEQSQMPVENEQQQGAQDLGASSSGDQVEVQHDGEQVGLELVSSGGESFILIDRRGLPEGAVALLPLCNSFGEEGEKEKEQTVEQEEVKEEGAVESDSDMLVIVKGQCESIDFCPRCSERLDPVKGQYSMNCFTFDVSVRCVNCKVHVLIKESFSKVDQLKLESQWC